MLSGLLVTVATGYQPIRMAGAVSQETPLLDQTLTLHLLNCREGLR